MCKDLELTYKLSAEMYHGMALSLSTTIDNILQEPHFCNTHRSLNLLSLLEISVPLVATLKELITSITSLGPDHIQPITHELTIALATLTVGASKAINRIFLDNTLRGDFPKHLKPLDQLQGQTHKLKLILEGLKKLPTPQELDNWSLQEATDALTDMIQLCNDLDQTQVKKPENRVQGDM